MAWQDLQPVLELPPPPKATTGGGHGERRRGLWCGGPESRRVCVGRW
uniref:Uncharacterized protein n=1 Tax=Arundo donax TaxID=35708 RepID=A0A0A9GT77_ARUDO